MSESPASVAPSASERPVLVRGPALIAVLLLAAGVAVTLLTEDLGIAQFLLLLGGGWCAGFSFVNAVEQMPRNGLVLHLAVTIVLAAILVTVITSGSALIESVPEPLRGVLLTLNLAAIPATGWIVLGLLGRVTQGLRRREEARRPLRAVPDWQRDDSGDGSIVAFTAIEMPFRALTRAIVWIVVLVGALAVVLLIAFSDIVLHFGARLSIIVVGVVLALPAYSILTARLRRRTVACTLALGNDEVRIDVGGAASVIRYSRLDHLLWREKSDYARVEVRGAGTDISLLVGIATAAPGVAAELPPLPRRIIRRFEREGLVRTVKRRGGGVEFRRTDRQGSAE
ncbi:hypothetical protein ACI3KS_12435 [Microbacterium sp. ZW T5_45]|uniref:hypothetical protein n=1 Tax=Microbacterium sp. ZW T5_45 TaxID=3378080 RepID=UPI0038534970